MIAAITLYGLVSSLILNIRGKTVLTIIIKKSCLWASLLFPFFILDPNKFFLYLPFAIVVGYRMIFSAVKNEMIEFFIIYLVVLTTMNSSFMWLFAVIMLIKYAAFMFHDQEVLSTKGTKIEVGHMLDIVLLSISLVFMTFTHFYFGNTTNLQLSSLISLFFLVFFIYKSMGVIGPVYLKKLDENTSFDKRILTDSLFMFIIPLALVPSIRDILQHLIVERSNFILILFFLLFIMVSHVFINTKKDSLVHFLRLVYATAFTCNLFAYLYTDRCDFNNVILLNTIGFTLYVIGNIVDSSKILHKKYLLIIILLLILPTFLNPLFYKNLSIFNVMLEQAGFKVGLAFITTLLLPFAFISSSFEKVIYSSECVKINKVDLLKIVYWTTFLGIAYLAVYYGKI